MSGREKDAFKITVRTRKHSDKSMYILHIAKFESIWESYILLRK